MSRWQAGLLDGAMLIDANPLRIRIVGGNTLVSPLPVLFTTPSTGLSTRGLLLTRLVPTLGLEVHDISLAWSITLSIRLGSHLLLYFISLELTLSSGGLCTFGSGHPSC